MTISRPLVCVPQWDVLNVAIDGGWGDSAELEPEEQRAQMIEMIVDLFTMSTSLASWPSRLSIDLHAPLMLSGVRRVEIIICELQTTNRSTRWT